MKQQDFENLSITTIIVVFPSKGGRLVTKSTAMCDQGLSGRDRGLSLPACTCLRDRGHFAHDLTYSGAKKYLVSNQL